MSLLQEQNIQLLIAENRSLKEENKWLKEQIEWMKRRLFGKSSERFIPDSSVELYFPRISLFFNLFFPALISLYMIFLLLGWILQSIPFCAFFLHRCNDLYTQALLKGVSDLPPFLYWDITLTSLTPTLTIFLITCGWCLTSLFFKGGKNLS